VVASGNSGGGQWWRDDWRLAAAIMAGSDN